MSITLGGALQILQDLGNRPAISFHEKLVSEYILHSFDQMGVEARCDPYGNIIARITGMTAGVPPLAFVAHMDHPGFEAIELRGGMIVAEARGGVPSSSFSNPVPVEVVSTEGKRLKAKLAGIDGDPKDRRVLVNVQDATTVSLPASIVFELPDFKRDGDLLRMRAADDLAGCAAILSVMQDLANNPALGDVYGVFTRAEEVGLVGARVMAQEHSLPLDCLVVSLESSRELPGAILGSGPVIRVGDVTFTFSAEAEQVLHVAKQVLLAADPAYQIQRQLMSGGTCEASGFAAWGYATTGIAFPLGNYHNTTPEGGVDAEYIHADDFWGGIQLIKQAAHSVAVRRSSPSWKRLQAVPSDLQQRLLETAMG
ncbi:MAG: M20/M25/M40 family metallo-hydrolase [Chloroflexota bacterium]|nr:M20/M25/M40 family metallo-hydrolase [Chloroflexota bacterium]